MTNIVSYNPYDLPLRDRHRLLTGAIGPRPICWASTLSKEGNANLAPYSFFNLFSSNPPIVVFSSNRRGRDNTTKDTYHNLLDNGEVVVNIVSYDLVHQMNISSTDYAENINEFLKAGVTPIASEVVKPFRVKESPVQMECKVNQIINLGKNGGAGNLIICENKYKNYLKNSELKYPKFKFINSNIESINEIKELELNSIDFIFLNGAIHHLNDKTVLTIDPIIYNNKFLNRMMIDFDRGDFIRDSNKYKILMKKFDSLITDDFFIMSFKLIFHYKNIDLEKIYKNWKNSYVN